MGDTHQRKTTLSRLGSGKKGGTGEIVEVQGGHIVRSTGLKDRHSKVCTAKGTRDRRVRLSAHTAIQFYDVQDRLGYDRPSKAVDWLIKKAKSAIDELAELPAWNPHTATNTNARTGAMNGNPIGIFDSAREKVVENQFFLQNLQSSEMEENRNYNGSSIFLPPSLHSDSISDTIKSFFPVGASAMAVTPSSTDPFQKFPTDFSSRNPRHSEDLQLSLQSFHSHENEHVIFNGWPEQQKHHPASEISRFQRMYSWNSSETDTSNRNGSGEFVFSSSHPPALPPSPPLLQPFFGESQFFSQRGPLQSSNTPFLRAFPVDTSTSENQIPAYLHQPSFSSLGFASGGVSGFLIPAEFRVWKNTTACPISRPLLPPILSTSKIKSQIHRFSLNKDSKSSERFNSMICFQKKKKKSEYSLFRFSSPPSRFLIYYISHLRAFKSLLYLRFL